MGRVLLLMTTCLSMTWHIVGSMDFGQPQPTTRLLSSNGNPALVSVLVMEQPPILCSLTATGSSFRMTPEDRILAKKTSITSEEEKPVCVTSLAWIRGGTHLLVSFLNHHAEYV